MLTAQQSFQSYVLLNARITLPLPSPSQPHHPHIHHHCHHHHHHRQQQKSDPSDKKIRCFRIGQMLIHFIESLMCHNSGFPSSCNSIPNTHFRLCSSCQEVTIPQSLVLWQPVSKIIFNIRSEGGVLLALLASPTFESLVFRLRWCEALSDSSSSLTLSWFLIFQSLSSPSPHHPLLLQGILRCWWQFGRDFEAEVW